MGERQGAGALTLTLTPALTLTRVSDKVDTSLHTSSQVSDKELEVWFPEEILQQWRERCVNAEGGLGTLPLPLLNTCRPRLPITP